MCFLFQFLGVFCLVCLCASELTKIADIRTACDTAMLMLLVDHQVAVAQAALLGDDAGDSGTGAVKPAAVRQATMGSKAMALLGLGREASVRC